MEMFFVDCGKDSVFLVAFLEELREYAMKLHTKEQAPAEGKAEAPKDRKPVRACIFSLQRYSLVFVYMRKTIIYG